jgi:hypothetical protein
MFTVDDDSQSQILQWIYAAISVDLNYDSVRLWAGNVMNDVMKYRPSQYTLAAVGLLFY